MRLLKFTGPAPTDLVGARCFRAIDGDLTYAYLDGGAAGTLLTPALSVRGASHGQPAPFRYVVETDVLPEMEADFRAWYAEEHLPGLASVPGTVLAGQYLVEGDGPRYHSVYDLVSVETFNSPPWLAVRGTPWSDRVRPAFRHTIRTMFAAV